MAVVDQTLTGEESPVRPRRFSPGRAPVDRVFQGTVRSIALFVSIIFGLIGIFLGLQMVPTFKHFGIAFITGTTVDFNAGKIGLASTLLGTFEVALVALAAAFPLAMATALYISEYSPNRVKGFLVAMVDLMAAVPSVIYGLWGVKLFMPRAKLFSRFLSQYLGWIPFFRVDTDPNAASWEQVKFVGSAFIAGLCVAMMVLPIACSVMRGVFAEAPLGEREAAYALGSTKWGMIRTVVIPFGRGGIIGGTMLGLGRALGETIAVLFIISVSTKPSIRILQNGTSTISALIANYFGDATSGELSALLAAGFVLFVITLAVNTIAGVFVARGRSGSATEI